jgi:hypothetical protein
LASSWDMLFAPPRAAIFESWIRFAASDIDVELGRDMESAAGGLFVVASGSIVKWDVHGVFCRSCSAAREAKVCRM